MKTFYIRYSTGCTIEYICKSLLAAKQEATKRMCYATQLQGGSVVIYDNNNVQICYKSFNKFTEPSNNIGKWII